uniref:Uncharacterized protein n=1 Tax=Caenorhabditis japonica TaxID=281687 RepID=A0A8R1IYI4_CAEJA
RSVKSLPSRVSDFGSRGFQSISGTLVSPKIMS